MEFDEEWRGWYLGVSMTTRNVRPTPSEHPTCDTFWRYQIDTMSCRCGIGFDGFRAVPGQRGSGHVSGERSVTVCEAGTFSVDESWLSQWPPTIGPRREVDLFKRAPSQQKAVIRAALSESGGRVYGPSGAAPKLGMPRSTLESEIRFVEDQQESL